MPDPSAPSEVAPPPAGATAPRLSRADLDLLALLARGVSGADLSVVLGVNPRTVQRRICRIRGEFGVDTTVEAVVAAVRLKLI